MANGLIESRITSQTGGARTMPPPTGEESRPKTETEVATTTPPPAQALSAKELKRLTAAVKKLGVNVSDLLDAKGNLPTDKIQIAKDRIAAEAKKRGEKDPRAATRLYSQALLLDPKDNQLRLHLALAKFAWAQETDNKKVQKNLKKEAHEQLEIVLQSDQAALAKLGELDPALAKELAESYASEAKRLTDKGNKKNIAKIEAQLSMAYYLEPKRLDRAEALADFYLHEGMIAAGLGILSQALLENPKDERIKAKVLKIYHEGILIKKKEAESLAAEGKEFEAAERYEEIVKTHEVMEPLVEANLVSTKELGAESLKEVGAASLKLASLYEKINRSEIAKELRLKAVKAFTDSLKADPKSVIRPETLLLCAQAHRALGDLKAAGEDLRGAARLHPIDIPGGLTPNQALADFEKEFIPELQKAEAELKKAEGEVPADWERIRIATEKVIRFQEALGYHHEAKRLKEKLSEEGKQKLQEAMELKLRAAYEECRQKVETESDPTKKLFYEARLAELNGDKKTSRQKYLQFLSETQGSEGELKALHQQAAERVQNADQQDQATRKRAVDELKLMLGAMVPAPLLDAEGKLNLSRVRPKSFEEFHAFLLGQAEIDGIAFSQGASVVHIKGYYDSYRRILQDPQFKPLLMLLYAELNPSASYQVSDLDQEKTEGLMHRFTEEVASVSANRFVNQHAGSEAGQKLLDRILSDSKNYSAATRADVAKAVSRMAEDKGIGGLHAHQLEEQISSWNWFNVSITDDELRIATGHARAILREMAEYDAAAKQRQRQYLENPEQVRVISATDLGRKIKPEQIQRMAKLYDAGKDSPNLAQQMRAKLAALWLMAVDEENWTERNLLGTRGNRAYLIHMAESFLKQAEGVKTSAQFVKVNEEVQKFLEAPLPSSGAAQACTDEGIDSRGGGLMPDNLEKLFEGMPSTARQAYDNLNKFSDELSYSIEMGVSLDVAAPEIEATDPQLRAEIQQMIQRLQGVERTFWYQYKQLSTTTRIGSNVARLAMTGTITDIREANGLIDSVISHLKEAKTKEDLNRQVQNIYKYLEPGRELHKAFAGVEMDGWEQMTRLLQTVVEGAIIAAGTKGLGTGVAIARAAWAVRSLRQGIRLYRLAGAAEAGVVNLVVQGRRVQVMTHAARVQQEARLLQLMSGGGKLATAFGKSFSYGAKISYFENFLAWASGEVQVERRTFVTMLKDAFATGVAMGLFTPLAHSAKAAKPLLKAIREDFKANGARSAVTLLKGLLKNTGLETGEEITDMLLRKVEDQDLSAMDWEELRTVTLVCASGGSAAKGFDAMFALGNLARGGEARAEGTLKGEGRKEKGETKTKKTKRFKDIDYYDAKATTSFKKAKENNERETRRLMKSTEPRHAALGDTQPVKGEEGKKGRGEEGKRNLALPPAIRPINGFEADYEAYAPHVSQRRSDQLPKGIARKLQKLAQEGHRTGHEQEFFAVEFADGSVITSEFITSNERFRVKNNEARREAMEKLVIEATLERAQGRRPVRIHSYHSHPDWGNTHHDGRPYTETNSVDCQEWEAQAASFQVLFENLVGNRKPMEFVGGAVQAQSGPQESFYVASYSPTSQTVSTHSDAHTTGRIVAAAAGISLVFVAKQARAQELGQAQAQQMGRFLGVESDGLPRVAPGQAQVVWNQATGKFQVISPAGVAESTQGPVGPTVEAAEAAQPKSPEISAAPGHDAAAEITVFALLLGAFALRRGYIKKLVERVRQSREAAKQKAEATRRKKTSMDMKNKREGQREGKSKKETKRRAAKSDAPKKKAPITKTETSHSTPQAPLEATEDQAPTKPAEAAAHDFTEEKLQELENAAQTMKELGWEILGQESVTPEEKQKALDLIKKGQKLSAQAADTRQVLNDWADLTEALARAEEALSQLPDTKDETTEVALDILSQKLDMGRRGRKGLAQLENLPPELRRNVPADGLGKIHPKDAPEAALAAFRDYLRQIEDALRQLRLGLQLMEQTPGASEAKLAALRKAIQEIEKAFQTLTEEVTAPLGQPIDLDQARVVEYGEGPRNEVLELKAPGFSYRGLVLKKAEVKIGNGKPPRGVSPDEASETQVPEGGEGSHQAPEENSSVYAAYEVEFAPQTPANDRTLPAEATPEPVGRTQVAVDGRIFGAEVLPAEERVAASQDSVAEVIDTTGEEVPASAPGAATASPAFRYVGLEGGTPVIFSDTAPVTLRSPSGQELEFIMTAEGELMVKYLNESEGVEEFRLLKPGSWEEVEGDMVIVTPEGQVVLERMVDAKIRQSKLEGHLKGLSDKLNSSIPESVRDLFVQMGMSDPPAETLRGRIAENSSSDRMQAIITALYQAARSIRALLATIPEQERPRVLEAMLHQLIRSEITVSDLDRMTVEVKKGAVLGADAERGYRFDPSPREQKRLARLAALEQVEASGEAQAKAMAEILGVTYELLAKTNPELANTVARLSPEDLQRARQVLAILSERLTDLSGLPEVRAYLFVMILEGKLSTEQARTLASQFTHLKSLAAKLKALDVPLRREILDILVGGAVANSDFLVLAFQKIRNILIPQAASWTNRKLIQAFKSNVIREMIRGEVSPEGVKRLLNSLSALLEELRRRPEDLAVQLGIPQEQWLAELAKDPQGFMAKVQVLADLYGVFRYMMSAPSDYTAQDILDRRSRDFEFIFQRLQAAGFSVAGMNPQTLAQTALDLITEAKAMGIIGSEGLSVEEFASQLTSYFVTGRASPALAQVLENHEPAPHFEATVTNMLQGAVQAAGIDPLAFEAARLDYEVAKKSRERKIFQKALVKKLLDQGQSSDRPSLIFMAGPMGAGKSTVIGALDAAGCLELGAFLLIDADQIKDMIPEYSVLKSLGPDQAATAVHAESSRIADLLKDAALKKKKNIIIDGTMKNAENRAQLLARVRRKYPEYRISIIEVTAPEKVLLERVAERGRRTGRVVPINLVLDSRQLVRNGIRRLKNLADVTIEIENGSRRPILKSHYQDGTTTTINLPLPLPHETTSDVVDFQSAATATEIKRILHNEPAAEGEMAPEVKDVAEPTVESSPYAELTMGEEPASAETEATVPAAGPLPQYEMETENEDVAAGPLGWYFQQQRLRAVETAKSGGVTRDSHPRLESQLVNMVAYILRALAEGQDADAVRKKVHAQAKEFLIREGLEANGEFGLHFIRLIDETLQGAGGIVQTAAEAESRADGPLPQYPLEPTEKEMAAKLPLVKRAAQTLQRFFPQLIYRPTGQDITSRPSFKPLFQAILTGKVNETRLQTIIALLERASRRLEAMGIKGEERSVFLSDLLVALAQGRDETYLEVKLALLEAKHFADSDTPFATAAQSLLQDYERYAASSEPQQARMREQNFLERIIAAYRRIQSDRAQTLVEDKFPVFSRLLQGLQRLAGRKALKIHRVAGRPKGWEDIAPKLMRRGHRDMTQIADIVGTRIVVESEKYGDPEAAFDAVIAELALNYEIVEIDSRERLTEGHPERGYRARHLAVKLLDEEGNVHLVEIQLQTQAIYEWGKLQHYFYKNREALPAETVQALEAYYKACADYLWAMESGETAPPLPKAPNIPDTVDPQVKRQLERSFTGPNGMTVLLLRYTPKDHELKALQEKRASRAERHPAPLTPLKPAQEAVTETASAEVDQRPLPSFADYEGKWGFLLPYPQLETVVRDIMNWVSNSIARGIPPHEVRLEAKRRIDLVLEQSDHTSLSEPINGLLLEIWGPASREASLAQAAREAAAEAHRPLPRFELEWDGSLPFSDHGGEEVVLVGRGPAKTNGKGKHLQVPDEARSVSRHHASIKRGADGRMWVQDLSSAFGTRVLDESGQPVKPFPGLDGRPVYPLRPGYILELGTKAKEPFVVKLSENGRSLLPVEPSTPPPQKPKRTHPPKAAPTPPPPPRRATSQSAAAPAMAAASLGLGLQTAAEQRVEVMGHGLSALFTGVQRGVSRAWDFTLNFLASLGLGLLAVGVPGGFSFVRFRSSGVGVRSPNQSGETPVVRTPLRVRITTSSAKEGRIFLDGEVSLDFRKPEMGKIISGYRPQMTATVRGKDAEGNLLVELSPTLNPLTRQPYDPDRILPRGMILAIPAAEAEALGLRREGETWKSADLEIHVEYGGSGPSPEILATMAASSPAEWAEAFAGLFPNRTVAERQQILGAMLLQGLKHNMKREDLLKAREDLQALLHQVGMRDGQEVRFAHKVEDLLEAALRHPQGMGDYLRRLDVNPLLDRAGIPHHDPQRKDIERKLLRQALNLSLKDHALPVESMAGMLLGHIDSHFKKSGLPLQDELRYSILAAALRTPHPKGYIDRIQPARILAVVQEALGKMGLDPQDPLFNLPKEILLRSALRMGGFESIRDFENLVQVELEAATQQLGQRTRLDTRTAEGRRLQWEYERDLLKAAFLLGIPHTTLDDAETWGEMALQNPELVTSLSTIAQTVFGARHAKSEEARIFLGEFLRLAVLAYGFEGLIAGVQGWNGPDGAAALEYRLSAAAQLVEPALGPRRKWKADKSPSPEGEELLMTKYGRAMLAELLLKDLAATIHPEHKLPPTPLEASQYQKEATSAQHRSLQRLRPKAGGQSPQFEKARAILDRFVDHEGNPTSKLNYLHALSAQGIKGAQQLLGKLREISGSATEERLKKNLETIAGLLLDLGLRQARLEEVQDGQGNLQLTEDWVSSATPSNPRGALKALARNFTNQLYLDKPLQRPWYREKYTVALQENPDAQKMFSRVDKILEEMDVLVDRIHVLESASDFPGRKERLDELYQELKQDVEFIESYRNQELVFDRKRDSDVPLPSERIPGKKWLPPLVLHDLVEQVAVGQSSPQPMTPKPPARPHQPGRMPKLPGSPKP